MILPFLQRYHTVAPKIEIVFHSSKNFILGNLKETIVAKEGEVLFPMFELIRRLLFIGFFISY